MLQHTLACQGLEQSLPGQKKMGLILQGCHHHFATFVFNNAKKSNIEEKAPLVQELMQDNVGILSTHLAWWPATFKTTNVLGFTWLFVHTNTCIMKISILLVWF